MKKHTIISSGFFSILVLLFLALVVKVGGIAGCGGGNLDSNLKILASNVVFDPILPGALAAQTDTTGVDTQTKVLAGNVVLNAATGLSSDNLETALNEEIAVNLATTIIGTWSVENIEDKGDLNRLRDCNDTVANMNATGTVVFKSDGTYAVCSGRFGVAGIEFGDTQYSASNYSVKDRGLITITVLNSCPGNPTMASVTPPVIVTNSETDSINLTTNGSFGAGNPSGIRVSRLTRFSFAETCP